MQASLRAESHNHRCKTSSYKTISLTVAVETSLQATVHRKFENGKAN